MPPEIETHGALRRAAVVAIAALGYFWHLQSRIGTIPAYDGWFHIKFAALLPQIGFTRELPWAARSLWSTQFADNTLLFHVLLVPFTWLGDLETGLHLATAVLGAAIFLSFWWVLLRTGVVWPEAWTLLLLAMGGHFVFRMALPRPHLLSIVLLLWSVHLILNRRRWLLAPVIVIYALSYSAYHLPLALAIVVGIDRFLHDREIDWKTPSVIVGAMAVGVLINPYFPQNLRGFWTQTFVVPWMAFQTRVDLSMANELTAMSTRDLFVGHIGMALLVMGAAYLMLARPRSIDGRTRGLFMIALIYILMTVMGRRFVEYSVPMTMWFLASYFSIHLRELGGPIEALRRAPRRVLTWSVTGAGLLLVGFLLVSSYRGALVELRYNPPPLENAARYLAEHTEPDELVFTCDWDDGPRLFFYNHRNRYPVLLDPVFMYVWDAEFWAGWRDVAEGRRHGRTYETLAEQYRYGVCTFDFPDLREIVEKDPRMEIVYEDPGAYVFRIDREHPEIDLEDFMNLGPSE